MSLPCDAQRTSAQPRKPHAQKYKAIAEKGRSKQSTIAVTGTEKTNTEGRHPI